MQQIRNPTEDEKNAVALYNAREDNELYGMHKVRSKTFPYLYHRVRSITLFQIDLGKDKIGLQLRKRPKRSRP